MSDSRTFGEEGLVQAIERQRGASWPEFDFALFECLSWVYALEQVHEHAPRYANLTPPPDSLFRAECARSANGEKLLALQWARTFAGHNLLRVGRLHTHTGRSGVPGFAQPGWARAGAPIEVGPPRWVAATGLTSPNERNSATNRVARQFYEKHIQHRPLLEPLIEVKEYLLSLPPIT
jgi:hypothetical protein